MPLRLRSYAARPGPQSRPSQFPGPRIPQHPRLQASESSSPDRQPARSSSLPAGGHVPRRAMASTSYRGGRGREVASDRSSWRIWRDVTVLLGSAFDPHWAPGGHRDWRHLRPRACPRGLPRFLTGRTRMGETSILAAPSRLRHRCRCRRTARPSLARTGLRPRRRPVRCDADGAADRESALGLRSNAVNR